MSEELKPCPFCGQQDAFVEQLDSDASVVICQGMVDENSACLSRGPVGVQQSDMEDQPGREAAIAEWNRRAQPAEAEGVERWSKLKELAEKATPGPWVSFCRPSVQAVFGPNGVQANSEGTIVNWPGFDSSDTTKAKRKANANFIAAANPAAVLELLSALSAVTAERDRLREDRDSQQRVCIAEMEKANQLRAELETVKKVAYGNLELLDENFKLRAEVDELRKDKARLDAVEQECWDVRFLSSPNADAGDSSISIEIVGHFGAEPCERVVGENYNENLRAALDQAMTAEAYPPARPEYDERGRPVRAAMAAKEA